MRLSPQALSHQVSKNLSRCYLLYGNESFLIEESAQVIREEINKLPDVEHLILSETESEMLSIHLEQPSLFAKQKAIFLKISKPSVALANTLVKHLESPLTDCFIIIQTSQLTRQQQQAKWFTMIEKNGTIVAHWPLTGPSFASWVKARALKLGLKLKEDDFDRLLSNTSGNCLAAEQELSRLHLLSGDTSFFTNQSQYALSELCEAALLKQPDRVIKIVSYLKGSNEALQLVIWTLGQTLRALIHAANASKERQAAVLQRAGIRPQNQALYLKVLKECPQSHWLSMLASLSWADKQLKSGNESNAWQKILVISLQLAEMPVF
ncbi:MAG: DNA polymerase III subunit delta [Proteobacteria bacterium]|nr:DNA polymerase III subunit delta [Pseudomonadota bacterium]